MVRISTPVATKAEGALHFGSTTDTSAPPVSVYYADETPAPRGRDLLLGLDHPEGIDDERIHEQPNETARSIATLVIEALEAAGADIDVDPPVAMIDGGIALYAFPRSDVLGSKKLLVTIECYNSGALIFIYSNRNQNSSEIAQVPLDLSAISETVSKMIGFLNA